MICLVLDDLQIVCHKSRLNSSKFTSFFNIKINNCQSIVMWSINVILFYQFVVLLLQYIDKEMQEVSMRYSEDGLTFTSVFCHLFEVSYGLFSSQNCLIHGFYVLLLPPAFFIYELFLCFRNYQVRYNFLDLFSCKTRHIPFPLTSKNTAFFMDLDHQLHRQILLTVSFSHKYG